MIPKNSGKKINIMDKSGHYYENIIIYAKKNQD
jgi:hypothetical protein